MNKVKMLWERVDKVAQGNAKNVEKAKVDLMLDKLLDITICQHKIMMCREDEPGCQNAKHCKITAHISCTCIELEWL